MTYKGQSRFSRFLERVGLIHTFEINYIRTDEEDMVEDHNRMVRDG